jgi:hypothetical protein
VPTVLTSSSRLAARGYHVDPAWPRDLTRQLLIMQHGTLALWAIEHFCCHSSLTAMQWTVCAFMQLAQLLSVLSYSTTILAAAPAGFPKSGNGLWYTQPGGVWSREWLPVGNGYLAGEFSVFYGHQCASYLRC